MHEYTSSVRSPQSYPQPCLASLTQKSHIHTLTHPTTQPQEHYFREKPAELTAALDSSLPPSAAASALTHYADGGNTRAPALHDFHVVSKPVSALSAAISAAASSGGAAAAGADGQAQAGMPKVGKV